MFDAQLLGFGKSFDQTSGSPWMAFQDRILHNDNVANRKDLGTQ